MAFSSVSAKFVFVGVLFSFCIVQNVSSQNITVNTKAASWNGKSPFKEFFNVKPANGEREKALLLTLVELMTKENNAYKKLENSDILSANAKLGFKIVESPDEPSSEVTLNIVLKTAEAKKSNSDTDIDVESISSNLTNLTQNQSHAAMAAAKPSKFAQVIVKRHNAYRKKHRVPKLTYNEKISRVSQDWANTLARTDEMKHRPNNKYGENIYMYWSSSPKARVSPISVVDSWYGENKYYSYSSFFVNIASVGHFTQVVWKDSKEIGVGVAKSKSGRRYVVCNYSPPGNILGRFSENVLEP